MRSICNTLRMNLQEYKTPGQLLEKLLNDRDWSRRILAVILGLNETIITKIINGARSVDAELALKFEAVFDVPAEDFLQLQQQYDLNKARITEQPDPTRATRATLFGDLPVPEMIRRGWLDVRNAKDVSELERALVKFFGVSSLDEIEILPHAARKTKVTDDEATAAQLAWIYRVKQLASETMVASYSEIGVRSAIKKLEPLMMSVESIRKVPRILAEAGIRFVIVESVGSAKIDGVCLWLDKASPVIGMTLRYDRIDNFWFVLRHEVEHVAHLHGQNAIILDRELEGSRAGTGSDVSEDERIANHAAANFGFSQEYLQKFISRKAPFFREIDVLGFAQTVQVHPGIAVGRIQYATGRYDLLRKYLVKVRSKIAPSAMVDGWGEVAPVDV